MEWATSFNVTCSTFSFVSSFAPHPASVTAAIASTSAPVSHFPFINRFSCFFILTLEYDFPVKMRAKNEGEMFEFRFSFVSYLVFLLPSVLLSSGFCLRTFSDLPRAAGRRWRLRGSRRRRRSRRSFAKFRIMMSPISWPSVSLTFFRSFRSSMKQAVGLEMWKCVSVISPFATSARFFYIFHSTMYLIAPSTHLGFLFRNFLF